jgi:alpha-L-fucosidase 2
MVYGYTGIERIQLNEDSLWYGGFLDRNNGAARGKLAEVRRLILAGNMKDAESLLIRYFTGAPYSMRHYEPLGELDIALNQHTPFKSSWFCNSAGAENYISELDLMTGVHAIGHEQDGVSYKREMFISYPAQVLAIKLTSSVKGVVNLDIKFDRGVISDEKSPDERRPGYFMRNGPWPGFRADECRTGNDGVHYMKGNLAGTGFYTAIKLETDGVLENPVSQLYVRGASEVYIYLAASTTNRDTDPEKRVRSLLESAASEGYGKLKSDHIADFEPRMERCVLELPGGNDAGFTGEDIEKAGADDSYPGFPALAALYFTFGRYLLLSGGRENSAALNLQGIWNKDFIPSWDSKYTININTEMNYWPAELTGLGETHESLFSLIKTMTEKGRDTARIMYGCRGSMCHHNTDFYGDCAPQDVYMAATVWPTGGAWMATHIWEHYRFTLDKDFLRKWYPTLKEHALFFLDFLSDDGKGYLVTNPSLSPENRYIRADGRDTPICAGPAMDNQILRYLFNACIEADRILDLNDPMTEEFRIAMVKLPPNRIGSKGRLLEWREEEKEMTPGMGHISHLWGAYPGDEINWKDTPDLLEAAKKSLAIRAAHGAAGGGWPLAWFICQAARQGNGRLSGEYINRMVSRSGTRNFFNGNRVFQIDGNLGAAAGIGECLLQSHTGIIELLPALPPSWKEGRVKGLRARGAYTVDIEWYEGKLKKAVITAGADGVVAVRGELLAVSSDGRAVAAETTAYGFTFVVKKDSLYTLTPA